MLVALALAALLAFGLAGGFDATDRGPDAAEPTPRAVQTSPEFATTESFSPVAARVEADSPPQDAQPRTAEERAWRFDGVARVRGRVRVEGANALLPTGWKVALEPSPSLVTTARVERREVEGGADGAFAFEDVPLGGYELVVDAGDLDCPRRPLLLAKPESTDLYLVVIAREAGEVLGRVLDAHGLGAEGVDVALVRDAASDERRVVETRTGPGGTYRLRPVQQGEWRLFVGSESNPLVPARELAFALPRLTAPDVGLPPCGEVEVLVNVPTGRPAPGISVAAYGAAGAARAVTDDEGKARLRWLAAGRASVVVESQGRVIAQQTLTIVADELAATRFVVEP